MRSYPTTVVVGTTREEYRVVIAEEFSVVDEARIIISLNKAGMRKKNPQINTTILIGANTMAVQEDNVVAEVVEGMGIVALNSNLNCSSNLSSNSSLNNTATLTKPNRNEGTSNSPTGTPNLITAKHANNKTCPAINHNMTTTTMIANTTMSRKKSCSQNVQTMNQATLISVAMSAGLKLAGKEAANQNVVKNMTMSKVRCSRQISKISLCPNRKKTTRGTRSMNSIKLE